MKSNRLLIIVPAYNEAKIIGYVLRSLPKKIKNIDSISTVVVDDGSTDKTADIARRNRCFVVRHIINRGLGAALGTGFEYALRTNATVIVTFDADGQHKQKDIIRIIAPLLAGTADVVIGSRLLSLKGMPLVRLVVIFFSNLFTMLLTNMWTTDSQSGLRAFSRHSLERIKISSLGMEVSSEIFEKIKKNKLRLAEVPITPIYTSYSLKKGQKISNAPNVAWRLLLQQFN